MLKLVISTPNDLVRAENVKMQMTSQGIEDYKLIPANMIPKMARTGISRSHKTCIKRAIELKEDKVLIMEDDLNWLCPNAYKRFIDILYSEVPQDADLFFSGAYTVDSELVKVTGRLAECSGKISGLHAYVVFEKFYEKFLSADEAYNIDHFLTAPDLLNAKSYIAYPFLCIQNDGHSYNVGSKTNYNEGLKLRYKFWDGN